MNNKGLKHWNSSYPEVDSIQSDLGKGDIYILKDRGVCKAMVTLNDIEPEEYRRISWTEGSLKPLYLHRMAVHPKWQGTGLAKRLIDFAGSYARDNGYNSIRLDVYSPSERAKLLYEKHDFHQTGDFYTGDQTAPYICYEKRL